MNYDKISIYVQPYVKTQLEDDAIQFEVFSKKDGSTNMNKFITRLLLNYSDIYMDEYLKKSKEIESILLEYFDDLKSIHYSTSKIIQEILYPTAGKQKGIKKVSLSLKPTKETEPLIDRITRDSNIEDTISGYFSRMLTSYCSKSVFERERIIFGDTFSLIEMACEKNLTISFKSYWTEDKIFNVLPYKIVTNKDKIYNYLLCQDLTENTAKTFRINRLSNIILSTKKGSINSKIKNNLDLMILNGPEYSINDNVVTKIKMTQSGIKAYSQIYFGRPKYYKVEKQNDFSIYYFNCSEYQLFNYFRRFEKDSIQILQPISLQEKLINFHYDAYRSLQSTDSSQSL